MSSFGFIATILSTFRLMPLLRSGTGPRGQAFALSVDYERLTSNSEVVPGSSGNRKSPIKENVKRKVLPFGSMPIFFSRHSAQLFGPALCFFSPVVPISSS